jgi:hypothetical protein
MIQKYFSVPGTKEATLREISAVEHWTEWMPGVTKADTLKSEASITLINLIIKTTTTIQMTMELDCCEENRIRFRQVKGFFKKYAGDYTVLPAPDGNGTTFRITLEVDAGMLAPKGMVYNKMGAMLDQFEHAFKKRISECAPMPLALPTPAPVVEARSGASVVSSRPAASDAQQSAARRKLAHVFPTRRGLEVWVAGRPYRLKAIA